MPSKSHILSSRQRTDDIKIDENLDFSSMFLSDNVLLGLNKASFFKPSPIQLSAIPLARCGLDLVIQAKNGTGKTLVFTITALEMVSVQSNSVQTLVLAPTREIAYQISDVIQTVGREMNGLNVQCFIGGLSVQDDKKNVKGCHIAVGTPGRLMQLINSGVLKLDNLKLVVFDEADQLLSSQFVDDIKTIMSFLPLRKQSLALSATYSEESQKIIKSLMKCPSEVKLGHDSPALLGVNQAVIILPSFHHPHKRHMKKYECLLKILKTVKFNQCLVFSNSQLRAESTCNKLKAAGWPVSFLSGARQQKERLEAYTDLCTYKCRVLVSTDLSARGLDSQHVNLVINLDGAFNQATYLHRVGRAGRFGSFGGAISIVCEGEELQTLKAVSMLANVNVGLISEELPRNIAVEKVEFTNIVERLSEEALDKWILKEQSWKKSQIKASSKDPATTQEILPPSDNKSRSSSPPTVINGCTGNLPAVSNKPLNVVNEYKSLDSISNTMKNHNTVALKKTKAVAPVKKEQSSFTHALIREFDKISVTRAALSNNSSPLKMNSVGCRYSSLLHLPPNSDFLAKINALCPEYVNPRNQAEIVKEKAVHTNSGRDSGYAEQEASHVRDSSATTMKATDVPNKLDTSSDNYYQNTGYGAWTTVEEKKPVKTEKLRRRSSRRTRQSSVSSHMSSVNNRSAQTQVPHYLNSSIYNYENYFQTYAKSMNNYVQSMHQYTTMFLYTQMLGKMHSDMARMYSHTPKNFVHENQRND